ncbi:hypothetical protein [Aestuariivivens sp. NBU2969]|uniref:hypothetical protein n=1 Tax=Aestuariivivens sp. NBU2969 TaxID=2873267 RepID=UPI001CBC6984|nr:hypothetical protein [Aestuariivivens sp. NBU2969]
MKHSLNLLTAFILILSFTSCSQEEVQQDVDLLGIWENMASTKTYTLVFGQNNAGLSIETYSNGSEISSSAIPFNWIINNKEVLLLDGATPQGTYVINDEGQLVSSDLQFVKVSSDYSKYY